MDKMEWEAYRRDREARIESLTRQLKEAVATNEKLLHLLVDALPTLRSIDDPTIKKLVEKLPVM